MIWRPIRDADTPGLRSTAHTSSSPGSTRRIPGTAWNLTLFPGGILFLFSPSKLKLYRFSHSYSSPAGSPLPAASLLTNPDPPSWRVSCRSMHFVFLGWLSQRVVKKGWEGSLGDRRSTCEVVWRLIFNNKGNSLQLKSLLGNERCIIISYQYNLLTID